MNRDISGEAEPFASPTSPSAGASSSSYLVYLFLISAALIVVLPYTFPGGGILTRSGSKKADVAAASGRASYSSKKVQSSPYATYPSSLASEAVMRRVYSSESKCDALEVLVMDLQKVVHIEREKTLQLENEIRVLQISENFLKERIQYLEDRSWESRKDSSASPSVEFLLRNAPSSPDGRRDTVVHELMRMVQSEEDRTTALEAEVRILQKSETILVDRIQRLEDQFAAVCKPSNVCEAQAAGAP